mmetsp:Transcript_15655/g.23601  ORF Transcript_15655/g.23601 Transcript_15655/m.23601 type:complete len:217 (-) Transcript_15655:135-785(-)
MIRHSRKNNSHAAIIIYGVLLVVIGYLSINMMSRHRIVSASPTNNGHKSFASSILAPSTTSSSTTPPNTDIPTCQTFLRLFLNPAIMFDSCRRVQEHSLHTENTGSKSKPKKGEKKFTKYSLIEVIDNSSTIGGPIPRRIDWEASRRRKIVQHRLKQDANKTETAKDASTEDHTKSLLEALRDSMQLAEINGDLKLADSLRFQMSRLTGTTQNSLT